MTKEQLRAIEGHTPGPWQIGPGKRIERVLPAGGSIVVVSEHSVGMYQNQNLIVAAPQLLAERNALLAALKSTIPMLDYYNEREGCYETLREATDAIALAEGSQS